VSTWGWCPSNRRRCMQTMLEPALKLLGDTRLRKADPAYQDSQSSPGGIRGDNCYTTSAVPAQRPRSPFRLAERLNVLDGCQAACWPYVLPTVTGMHSLGGVRDAVSGVESDHELGPSGKHLSGGRPEWYSRRLSHHNNPRCSIGTSSVDMQSAWRCSPGG
jgi:hypothetical protein